MELAVYKLFWDNCPFYYFGLTGDIKNRLTVHMSSFKCSKQSSKKLQSAYDTFGAPKHQILTYAHWWDAKQIEIALIEHHSSDPNCCNIHNNKTAMDERWLKVKENRAKRGFITKKPRKPQINYSDIPIEPHPLAYRFNIPTSHT